MIRSTGSRGCFQAPVFPKVAHSGDAFPVPALDFLTFPKPRLFGRTPARSRRSPLIYKFTEFNPVGSTASVLDLHRIFHGRVFRWLCGIPSTPLDVNRRPIDCSGIDRLMNLHRSDSVVGNDDRVPSEERSCLPLKSGLAVFSAQSLLIGAYLAARGMVT